MTTLPWVFLRGLIRQHRHWEEFPSRFEAAFPGARVILLDLPGNGDLSDEDSPTSLRGMVLSVRRQLRARGIAGPVNVLAISLGAMTAIEWMHAFPGEVDRAVLMNTSLRGTSSLFERMRPSNYLPILRMLARPHTEEERERLVLSISSNLHPRKDEVAARWAGYAKEHPITRANAVRQMLAAARYAAPAKRPHDRVLVLRGLGDRLVNPVCSERIAARWGWELRSHPTAGHDLTLDAGEWVLGEIGRWVGQA